MIMSSELLGKGQDSKSGTLNPEWKQTMVTKKVESF